MAGKTTKVADLFCGAGGSSKGAQTAIEKTGGTMELVAVNHWQRAIETHQANHPTARHIVEDVSVVDPEAVVEEGYLDILMASPECTYHSRARGGKPIHDQGRMTPWAIFNWLSKLDVKTVLVENVPEFVHWGPLDPLTRRPIKSRKGEQFQAWLMNFFMLGYQAEFRMLNAADYGDATTRVRFFLIARNDGIPIRWPEPTHAKVDTPMFGGLQPWRGAREIIDWDNAGRSLLDDPKYLKKPLSENTRKRIARGLERFGGALAERYISLLDLPQDMGKQARAGKEEEPFILSHQRPTAPRSQDNPGPTITGRGPGCLVEASQQPSTAPTGRTRPPGACRSPSTPSRRSRAAANTSSSRRQTPSWQGASWKPRRTPATGTNALTSRPPSSLASRAAALPAARACPYRQ